MQKMTSSVRVKRAELIVGVPEKPQGFLGCFFRILGLLVFILVFLLAALFGLSIHAVLCGSVVLAVLRICIGLILIHSFHPLNGFTYIFFPR